MDASAIEDPRAFADPRLAPPPDAAIYDAAARSLAAGTAREADALADAVRDSLAERLRGDGSALAALFAGAPSVDVTRVLWRSLDRAWRDAVAASSGVGVTIYALPIVVVVAGTSSPGKLDATLRDAAKVDRLLRDHGALRGNDSAALAESLAAPDALDLGRLPEVLAWHTMAGAAHVRALAPAAIAFVQGRESVHARLAVGAALAAPGIDLLSAPPRRGWAIAVTGELARQLATPAATVLALPGAPQRPLQAVRQARSSQREVAAQVFASNALRDMRMRAGEPTAIVSAHRAADAPGGGELRVSLASPLDSRPAEGFRCPLHPLDRASDVAAMLVSLLRACDVADVTLVPGVHADLAEGTSRPLLFTPDSLPALH